MIVKNIVSNIEELKQRISDSAISNLVSHYSIERGQISLTIKSHDVILPVLKFLKDSKDMAFDQLVSICGVDLIENHKRFKLVYNMLSIRKNLRIRVELECDDVQPVPSVIELFRCANWYEREIWDMYGIRFAGHEDLRRILSDYNFAGYPLRKDFPLTGYVEVRYSGSSKRVVHEDVELPQEYRSFDFESAWEGYEHKILPGDEKANQ